MEENFKEEKKENSNFLSEKLWTIFKFISGITILLIIAYKIIIQNFSITISNLDYNILLSYFLAFFSIILSMLFYFKSNDSSNKFYDNTYKFTKDISNILGRIEAGFGEKLQNLDKGYSGILNKIEKTPTNADDIEETKTDKKEVELSLHNEIKERNKIIQDLIEQTQLEQQEKEEIKNALYDKEKTILKLEKDFRILQAKLESQKNNVLFENIPERLISFLRRSLLRLDINLANLNRDKAQQFIDQFIPEKEERKLNDKLYFDLIENKIISENGILTNRGYTILRNILKMSSIN
ncbi:hypothetical protein ACHRV1_08630 [Flavobacterium aquidurense]|uniref:hypothetical protein n=1 Tax=Flavobacterium aquidurense TaxID=362413 RepID=UPI00375713E3